MTAISKDDFFSCLKASKVIAPEVLDKVLAGIESDDPKRIAVELVRKKLLTRWQAKYLVTGHSRLHVGNYTLLERLRQNEFGDRFLALHEQLDRLVEIQILPKSLNVQQDLREKFLSSASVASQVDHPNLVHVYDIDQEGKRLYLVVEHTEGKLLSSFEPTEFSTMDIARLVRQSLQGLQAAHEKGIVHGLINCDNIIVTQAEQVKIQNLVMASLENPNHATATQADDVQAIGKLGREFLSCLESTNNGRPELTAIIETVEAAESSDVTPILGELESWIEDNDTSTTQTVISGIAIETTMIDSAEPTPPVKPKDQQAERESDELIPPASFLHRQNPATVIGVAATICLLFLGGVAWLAYSMSPSTPVAKKTTVKKPLTTSTTVATQPDRPNLDSTGKLNRPRERSQQQVKDFERKPMTKQEILAELDKIGADESAKSLTAVSAEFSGEHPADQLAEAPAESAPAIESPPPVDSTPMLAEAEEKPPLTEPDSIVEQPENPDPAEKSSAVAKEEKTQNKLPNFDEPFEEFPRYTDLGDIADASPREIGKLNLPPNILMAAEIISGNEISRSKFMFELERSTGDKQRWIAKFKKRKAAAPVEVGEFFRKDNAFYFQWDSAAVEDDNYNYLRNCTLKLLGNNSKVTFLNLRAPVEIEGLAITQENGMAKIETDIRWLPDPESLKIEVIPMPYKGIPKSFMFPPDRQVRKRQPVLVFFEEQEKKRFFYLQVSADVKKKLNLESALMFNALDGSNPIVTDPELIEKIIQQITHLASVTNADYEQIKVADRPKDIKYDDFEELKRRYKKAAETAQAQKVTLLEYANMIPALYGKSIPVRVYFEMDNMQIELAKSSPSE